MSDQPSPADQLDPDWHATPTSHSADAPEAFRGQRRAFPASIGGYRILALLGEGGMGTVYQAEQKNPQRIVALKVIKLGVANEELLRRFEQEAEASETCRPHCSADPHPTPLLHHAASGRRQCAHLRTPPVLSRANLGRHCRLALGRFHAEEALRRSRDAPGVLPRR